MTFIQPQLTKTLIVPQPIYLPVGVTPAFAANATANRATFVPFTIDQPGTTTNVYLIQNTALGNYDVGIYSATGTRLASTGSTAVGAASTIAATLSCSLTKGRYYIGVAFSDATEQIWYYAGPLNNALLTTLNCKYQDTALPLPATATWSDPPGTMGLVPIFGIRFA